MFYEAKKQIFHLCCYIIFYMIKERGYLLSIVIIGRVLLREPRTDSEMTTVPRFLLFVHIKNAPGRNTAIL